MPARPSPDAVDIRVLGPLELRIHGAEVPVPAGTQRTLLALLVLARGRAATREHLAVGLWGLDQPKDPRAALHTAVARLRRTLGPEGEALRTLAFGYGLDLPADAVDAERFSRLHGRVRALLDGDGEQVRASGAAARAAELLEEALALWRGPAWADVADGVASGDALRLEEERLVVLEDLAQAHLAAGAVDRAVAVAGSLAEEHPLRDRTIGLLVDALHRYGRTADALAVVDAYRERRAEELGLDPAPVVAAAHLRVLRQELPAATSPAGPGGDGGPGARPGGWRPAGPAPAGALVGREVELREVSSLLRSARVVTLVGPGGVGKTALVRHLADAGPASATWVDLAVVRDRAGLHQALADALGVEAGSPRALEELVVDRLAGEPGLVVLDNCEHLLDDVAPLLAGPPGAGRVLATSRERLGIPGEHVVVLAPLAVPDPGDADDDVVDSPAAELFLRRAAEAGARLGSDPRSRREVAAVCRSLDGLPLALELAAGRVGGLTLEDLLARLDRRFDVLTRGPRTAPRRQRTLRAVFDWSYELLDDDERAVFGRLAVFPSGFTLAAAESVVADGDLPPERVPDVLAGLVGRSMVPPPSSPPPARYRMLETVRQYALSRLPATELAPTRRRHALWTVGEAERIRVGLEGAEEEGSHAAMSELVDDLRAAWRWSREASDADVAGRLVAATWRWAYWRLRADVLAWGAQLLRDRGREAPVVAYPAAAAAAWLDADPEEAERVARTAVRLHGADPDLADVHEVLGDVRMTQADAAGALEAYTLAERMHRARGDEHSATVALAEQVLPVAYAGGPWRDRVHLAVDAARRSGNPTARAIAHYAEAEACVAEDEAGARAALDEALGLSHAVGNRLIIGIATTASVALEARATVLEPRTWGAFDAAIRYWRTSRSSTLLAPVLRNLVILLGRTGRHEEAVELWAAVEQAQGAHQSYGAEAERIDQVLTQARTALGAGFEAAVDRGRGCPDLDAAARLGARFAAAGADAAGPPPLRAGRRGTR